MRGRSYGGKSSYCAKYTGNIVMRWHGKHYIIIGCTYSSIIIIITITCTIIRSITRKPADGQHNNDTRLGYNAMTACLPARRRSTTVIARHCQRRHRGIRWLSFTVPWSIWFWFCAISTWIPATRTGRQTARTGSRPLSAWTGTGCRTDRRSWTGFLVPAKDKQTRIIFRSTYFNSYYTQCPLKYLRVPVRGDFFFTFIIHYSLTWQYIKQPLAYRAGFRLALEPLDIGLGTISTINKYLSIHLRFHYCTLKYVVLIRVTYTLQTTQFT